MKNLKSPHGQPLTRKEMKQVTGGTTQQCLDAWAACHANCAAGFSVGYPVFAQCIDDLHPWPCSPLAGWQAICGS